MLRTYFGWLSLIRSHYAPFAGDFNSRNKGGHHQSMGTGKSAAFAMDGMQMRGDLFVDVGIDCYEVMIVGEHCLDPDRVVK
jgi:GTP-binding protein